MTISQTELLDALPTTFDGLVVFDSRGKVVFINDRGCDLFGWTETDALGLSAEDLFRDGLQWSDGSRTVVADTHAIETIEGIQKNGSKFMGEISCSERTTTDGAVLVVLVRIALSHTSNLQEIKAELLDQFADHSGVAFFLREGDTALYLDPRLLVTLGFDPSLPTPTLSEVRALIYPDDRSATNEQVATLDAGTRPPPTQLRVVVADGKVRWFRALANPYVTAYGANRVASMFVDITDLKEAEEATKRALAETVEANAAKNEFLSRMSHELRTPLNAILGYSQLLEMESESAEHRDYAKKMIRSGKHLLGLIDETLDIARMERGEMRLSLESVSVSDVLREASEMLLPMAERHGIHLIDNTQSAATLVLADRQRLRQVIVNFLSNAIKYNRRDGEVRAEYELLPDERIRVSVVDTGIGIAEDELHLLFQPFERLGAKNSAIEGTGLGLALTRHLMQAMGGDIGVTSAVGSGSTFWIELPTAKLTDFTFPSESSKALEPSNRSPQPMTVLYIEDNLSNVQLLETIMAHRPEITLIVATNSILGLELATNNHPDLILLDLHLPEISGEEVLYRLKAESATASIPVVIVSADATMNLQKKLLSKGASDYVTKPFDISRLFAVLDSLDGMRAIESARVDGGEHQISASSNEFQKETGRSEKRSRQFQEFRHDLNNSLGVIVTYSELLSRTIDDQNTVNASRAIHEAAKAAVMLVDQFERDSI